MFSQIISNLHVLCLTFVRKTNLNWISLFHQFQFFWMQLSILRFCQNETSIESNGLVRRNVDTSKKALTRIRICLWFGNIDILIVEWINWKTIWIIWLFDILVKSEVRIGKVRILSLKAYFLHYCVQNLVETNKFHVIKVFSFCVQL